MSIDRVASNIERSLNLNHIHLIIETWKANKDFTLKLFLYMLMSLDHLQSSVCDS